MFTLASDITATLVYGLVGGVGLPLSPLLLVIPLVPAYALLMKIEGAFEEGSTARDRLIVVGCVTPVVVAVTLALLVPLPVWTSSIPRLGAFGLTVTACVAVGALLLARAQWVNRSRG